MQGRSWRISPRIASLLVVIVIIAIAAGLLFTNLRGGELQLGSDDRTPTIETTPEATADTGQDIDTADALPQINPPQELAFISNRNGNWDIFTITSDGTLTNLTQAGDAQDYFASWSLDGAQINFLANRLSADALGPSQVQADGSELRSLDIVSAILTLFSEQRFDWDPAWSPDGTRILWSSLRDLNLELYTIPLDSDFTLNNATRLTAHAARDWFGAWAPDGERVVFSSDRNGNEDIFMVDANGENLTQLTSSEWDEIHAMFDVDGERIAYVFDDANILLTGDINLYIMDADGSNPRPLDEPFTGDLIWAPDGSVAALISNEATADNPDGLWQIYLMNAGGNHIGRITLPDGDYLFPVWRP